MSASYTRFFVLGLFALSLTAAFAPAPPGAGSAAPGGADLVLYDHIVDRVAHGEDYYRAAFDELQAGGYPTQSVFNWRMPTYAWLLSSLPGRGRAFLIALAVLALALAFVAERRRSGAASASILVLLLIGVVVWCVDGEAFLAQEVWVAVLLILALACDRLGWPWAVFAAAATALFLRELVLPFTILAAWQACRQRRFREASAWAFVWTAFIAFFLWHAGQVRAIVPAGADAAADGWIAWGGLRFVLQTVQMNQWIYTLPLWVTALYFSAGLAGLIAFEEERRGLAALTALFYTAAFLIVGKPFNTYWGLLFAPTLPFGIVRWLGSVGATAAKERWRWFDNHRKAF